jgi:GTP-binding protein
MMDYTLRRQKRFRDNCNLKRNKREGRYIRFLKVALFVTRQTLPQYSHNRSPHTYSLPQLISCVLLKIYVGNISYRDLEELLLSSGDMQRVLGLRGVPDYSTLSRACNRISEYKIQRILEKVLEVIGIRTKSSLVFACDSTGFKEDVASFYYALRSGKKRKRWIKVFYLLDTRTQACVSEVIGRGPSGDSWGLPKLEKKSPLRSLIEVMDRGFDGNGNFHFGLPIRIIPPIRGGGGIKSCNRILAYMVYTISKWMGIYGRRWLCETMNSVIKRKFSDSIRERKWGNKKRIVSLIAIAYNIHLVVRSRRKYEFLLLAFISLKTFLNKMFATEQYCIIICLTMVKFVDEAKIYVKSGRGGRGCVSFRREKFVPRGGPNGGDGGDGGDVIVIGRENMTSLLDYHYKQHYRAQNGEHGKGKDQHGKNAPPLLVPVPIGTVVRDFFTGEILGDITEDNQTLVVARGGHGGRGNARFATSTNQAPRCAQPGEEGEEKTLILELKLLADVGIIGFPNAGKSTLISRISAARPKIADYPFTTLIPNLGVVSYNEGKTFVVADIPGLIEGAHEGAGLGTRFLRHIERTKVLIHLLDLSPFTERDPIDDYRIMNEELEAYSPELKNKPQIIAPNKIDIAEAKEKLEEIKTHFKNLGIKVFPTSSATGEGVKELIEEVWKRLERLKS